MSYPRLLASLLALGLAISTAAAQSPTPTGVKKKTKPKPAAVTPAADSQPAPSAATAATPAPVETAAVPAAAQPADTTAAEPKKKHHGLFGKVKDVASNKVVQSVAKTAACTMVPGGSAIASAIDAGSSHSAAGAASAAAGAPTGSSCYGGMGGMGGAMGGGMGGMGGAAAMAAQQQAMASQQKAMMAQQQQAMMMQQQQALMMQQAMAQRSPGAPPPMAVDPAQMGMEPDDKTAAACMGISVEEYHLITDPPPVPESKAHMKAVAAAGKKIDQAKQRECAMQAGNQMMSMATEGKAEVETKIANARSAGVTEAPGKTIEMATDATSELKKGKTAVRNIDWVAGSTDVSEPGKQPFDDAMSKLAAALRETGGGQYRVDLYMDQRYDETAVTLFGPARIAEVHAALSSNGVSPAILLVGKAKRDKNPRLELVKVK